MIKTYFNNNSKANSDFMIKIEQDISNKVSLKMYWQK
jgi:hypothetical protein